MPLLDHFHEPLAPRRRWESFHVNWAGAMADELNERLLPEGYFAEEHAHIGPRVEIDVATFGDAQASAGHNGPTATQTAPAWAPPAPSLILPAAFPDRFEVFVFASEGGAEMVAAIELVSPSNKDRPDHRRAFAIKCASYLVQGINLVVVDVVTSRRANLHNEIMQLLGHDPSTHMPPGTHLYGAAYRPLVREEKEQTEAWTFPLTLGGPMPVVPLALNAEITLPLNLESTYTVACRRRRITGGEP